MRRFCAYHDRLCGLCVSSEISQQQTEKYIFSALAIESVLILFTGRTGGPGHRSDKKARQYDP
jgi:hypothetical protein